jgi:hypothetical protein
MATTTTATRTTGLTLDEMISKARKVLDLAGNYYLVESATTAGQEYKVSAIRKNGRYHLVCNCAAGKEGRNCWHRRAATAAETELRQALADQAVAQAREHLLIVNGVEADDATYNRVMNAKSKPVTTKGTLHYPAFSILRTA